MSILRSNPNAVVLGVDRDLEALIEASKYLKEFKDRVLLAHASFAMLPEVLLAAAPQLFGMGVSSASSCSGLANHIV